MDCALSSSDSNAKPMRLASLAAATAAIVAAGACRSTQVEVVRPALVAQPVHIAMPADTGFVRHTCLSPDSVLAGTRACYERDQKTAIRIF